jgi:hypothetical protein
LIHLFEVDAVAEITSNLTSRIFNIRVSGGATGTAFTIDVDQRQYLITAKHVVAGLLQTDVIQICKAGNWIPLSVRILRCDNPIDIAVLVPAQQISFPLILEADIDGIRYGQAVEFLGFPYNIASPVQGVNMSFPLPFVKSGTVSIIKTDNRATYIYFDGYNNPGFSGGPVVFRDARSPDRFKVAAVVSGFPVEYAPILKKEEIQPSDITDVDRSKARIIADGSRLFRLVETGETVIQNTGIVLAFSINHGVDLIRKFPIGPEVSVDFRAWPDPKRRLAKR